MRVQRRHHGRPPVVRGAGDPGPRVVVRHVLHQPLHRVPGVRGLVHAASILRVVRRPEHDELALAVESAADVLRYENVVLAAPSLCLRQTHFRRIFTRYPVRCAVDQKWQGSLGVLRREQHGLEPYAVPHRDHDFLKVDEYAIVVALSDQQGRARQPAEQNRQFHQASVRQNNTLQRFAEATGTRLSGLRGAQSNPGFAVPLLSSGYIRIGGPMADELNRRDFLKAAAIAAGPAVIAAQGANEKVNIGWIGVGTRGYAGLDWLHTAAADEGQITAICDTYQGYIARAQDRLQTVWGNKAKTFVDYRELLADRSIDAVYIMTPEHLHHDMTIAALKAGKHVYIEKPLAHTIEEGFDIVRAWQQSGKIVQVGTQNRSSALYKKAKELIKQGMVGDVHYVRAFWYRNSLPNDPAWRYVIPPEATPENTDFNRFLGTAPKRDWDPERYFQWRLYLDYSGGISTALLVHQTDIVNFMLDKTLPQSCMASGGIYRWTDKTDDRDVPDTLSAIYEYDSKFHINYSCYFGNDHYGYGEQVFGNEGTIEVMNRADLTFTPELYRGKAPDNIKNRKTIALSRKDFNQTDDGVFNHFRNFIMSVLGKEQPIAPPPIGQQAAISGHMATLAFKNQKKAIWDAAPKKVGCGGRGDGWAMF